MKKYKVEFVQTETFNVDVWAENAKDAEDSAENKMESGAYQERGDCSVRVEAIYDVTNTDDPFNP